jgi:predicted phage tail protein
VVRIARDAQETTPVMLFGPQTIVRGSLAVDYLMPTEETADAIDVTYWDEDYWAPRRVLCVLSGDTSETPVKVDLFGVVDRDQAHREGLYLAAVNRYRRKLISFEAELDAFVPAPGDLVAVTHDMPAWGQSGEITGYDVGTLTVTCSEPLTFGGGTHYLALRNRDGSVDGPITVTAGATAYEAVLGTAPAETPYTGQAAERTTYAFGAGETWRQPARVLSIVPTDWHRARVELINEDDSVHTADTGVTAPAIVTSALANRWTVPAVTGLLAMQAPDDAALIVVSWVPAPGADHYLIEQSEDNDSWTRVGETRTAEATVPALAGARTYIRVAGVGLTRGPWVTISYGGGGLAGAPLMWDAVESTLMWSVDSSTLMWT